MIDNFTEQDFVKRVGAFSRTHGDSGVDFCVWAPKAKQVELVLLNSDGPRFHSMASDKRGYYQKFVSGVSAGQRYFYQLDGQGRLPDPASRSQPEGVHGPSEVVDVSHEWTDESWRGLGLDELVVYELHVGTFTSEGTFDGVIKRIPHFKELGVNAIEIMPVAQFPGQRNWGYDGVFLFAAQNSYGGGRSLKRLVDECHRAGLAVILDVVYNHLGPEGNYLANFGPYFQSKYKTPWGEALNFDGECSDDVRQFFLQNAKQWFEEFHIDGLRLDAVHAIFDASAQPFLEDLSRLKCQLESDCGRSLHLIAESESNDSRLLQPAEQGGLGMDAQWADDFHHSLHSLLTGEKTGYYADYGKVENLVEVYRQGVGYSGQYSPFRRRSHGRSYEKIAPHRLVVCSQNHDQIGNRMRGERLLSLVGERKQRLAASCLFLSPFLPLIFMGEEFSETSPFLYFADHQDPNLIEAVREGRKKEFASFLWQGEPPDPFTRETYFNCQLHWQELESRKADVESTFEFYRQLISLSKWLRREQVLSNDRRQVRCLNNASVIELVGQNDHVEVIIYLSFSSKVERIKGVASDEELEIVFRSCEDEDGPWLSLAPFSATLLRRSQQ